MARTVTLVRHGQTELSQRRAYSGSIDVPLTAEGREQARRCAARLASEATIDAIFASPLSRARDTAQAIAEATGAPLTFDQRLVEIDYGPFEGMDRDEAAARLGRPFEDWRDDPFGAPVPGMETMQQVLERVRPATAAALDAAEHPLIVAHQGSLRIVLVALGELAPEDYFTLQLREAEPVVVADPRVR